VTPEVAGVFLILECGGGAQRDTALGQRGGNMAESFEGRETAKLRQILQRMR
jgi:hypothetical protein